jgi:hypothetical protein
METLLVAARPRELFWGKCLAMGVLGLAQLSLFLGFGALCYHFLVPEDFLIMGMPLSLSAPSCLCAYFLLGYRIGAQLVTGEDVNSAMMPVMISMVRGVWRRLERQRRLVPHCPLDSVCLAVLKKRAGAVEYCHFHLNACGGNCILSVLRLYSIFLHYGTRLKLRDIKKKS